MTAAPRDPLTLLRELRGMLRITRRQGDNAIVGVEPKWCAGEESEQYKQLLFIMNEIDQRLAAEAEAWESGALGMSDEHAKEAPQELEDGLKALAPGGREERLEKLKIVISGGLCYHTAEAKHAQLEDAARLVDELISRPQPSAQPTPDPQWQLVPKEPTKQMLDAIRTHCTPWSVEAYRNMLAAASQPPSGWRAIETAPKNKLLQLWIPEFEGHAAMAWPGQWSYAENDWVIHIPAAINARRVVVSELPAPTHWQPSPPPPSSRECIGVTVEPEKPDGPEEKSDA